MSSVYFVMSGATLYGMTHDKDKAINLWMLFSVRYEKPNVCIHEYELKASGRLIWIAKLHGDETSTEDDGGLMLAYLSNENQQ